MNPMVEVYVKAIKTGRMNIEDVPIRYKKDVEQELMNQ